jgi:branched-chain amino acid transport system permease protein
MTLARHLGAAIAAAIVIAVLTIKLGDYRDFQIAQIAAYVAAVAGLTVLIGTSGQISIGHGAFMAIGGYATALIFNHLHWNLILIFLAATAAAAMAGGIVGVAAARLRGPYLAGATLMLAVALPSLTDRYQGVLGGDQGLHFYVSTPGFLGTGVSLARYQAWLAVIAALVTLVLMANLNRSRVGRSWRALRDDEVAAALAGLNVAWLRTLAFVVSSACAGIGGALLAVVTGTVSPGGYALVLSIQLLTAAVLGGLGSLPGAVWGASLVLFLAQTYLQNLATSHGLSSSTSASLAIIAYGVVLVLVMLVFPSGIQGGLRRLFGPVRPAASAPYHQMRRRWPARQHQEEHTK